MKGETMKTETMTQYPEGLRSPNQYGSCIDTRIQGGDQLVGDGNRSDGGFTKYHQGNKAMARHAKHVGPAILLSDHVEGMTLAAIMMEHQPFTLEADKRYVANPDGSYMGWNHNGGSFHVGPEPPERRTLTVRWLDDESEVSP